MLALNVLLFGCIVVILIISTFVLLAVTAIDRATSILLKRSDAAESNKLKWYEKLKKFSRDMNQHPVVMDIDSASGEKNSRQDGQDQQDGLSRESGDVGLEPESQAKDSRHSTPDSSLFRPGQTVFAKERMEWMYGNSCTVKQGDRIVLQESSRTNAGIRWSGIWNGVFLSSIPEEKLTTDGDICFSLESGDGSPNLRLKTSDSMTHSNPVHLGRELMSHPSARPD